MSVSFQVNDSSLKIHTVLDILNVIYNNTAKYQGRNTFCSFFYFLFSFQYLFYFLYSNSKLALIFLAANLFLVTQLRFMLFTMVDIQSNHGMTTSHTSDDLSGHVQSRLLYVVCTKWLFVCLAPTAVIEDIQPLKCWPSFYLAS